MRNPGRWIMPILLVVFVVVPIAEIWLLIKAGQVIGGIPTIALVLVIAVLGSWLAKREGTRAWRALNETLRSGRMPQGELADAALVLVGAVLLIFPGFFSDIVGLAFLLPFTRPLCRRVLAAVAASRVKAFGANPGFMGSRPGPNPVWGDTIPGETVPQPDSPTHNTARDDRVIRGDIEP